MIIGITGHPAAGKDLAAEYLGARGFRHISNGDFLRKLMREQGLPTNRSSISKFVREMRVVHGNAYPGKEIVKTLDPAEDIVISGFRNMAEAELFRRHFPKTFFLVAIDAPVEVRYSRIHARGRMGDHVSFERFKQEEDAERKSDAGHFDVDALITSADVTVENTGTKEEFMKKLDKALANLSK